MESKIEYEIIELNKCLDEIIDMVNEVEDLNTEEVRKLILGLALHAKSNVNYVIDGIEEIKGEVGGMDINVQCQNCVKRKVCKHVMKFDELSKNVENATSSLKQDEKAIFIVNVDCREHLRNDIIKRSV